jgi:hypothetical protein
MDTKHIKRIEVEHLPPEELHAICMTVSDNMDKYIMNNGTTYIVEYNGDKKIITECPDLKLTIEELDEITSDPLLELASDDLKNKYNGF